MNYWKERGSVVSEGLAMIGIIYATFLIGLGVIGVLAIVLRVLLELIKEQANEK